MPVARAGRNRRPGPAGPRRSAATVRRKETHNAPRDPPGAVPHGARGAGPWTATTRATTRRTARVAGARTVVMAPSGATALARASVAAVDRPWHRSRGPSSATCAMLQSGGPICAGDPPPSRLCGEPRARPGALPRRGRTGMTARCEVRGGADRPGPSARFDGSRSGSAARAASALGRAGARRQAFAALMSPATTAADVDRHTEVYDEMVTLLTA